MTFPSSLERQAQALAGAQLHWQARRQEGATTPALAVAIAREAGAPGTSVARAVGARLGWTVYDHELLERVAQEMGLRTSLLESVDEKHQSWLLECAAALSSAPGVTESRYVHHLAQTVLSLGALGRCVIVGRGAAQLLPAASTLRVRLVAPLEERVEAMRLRLGVGREEAARKVEETDRERARFVRDHFQKDPTDPQNYDLILNSARWSVEECAGLILQALQQFQTRTAVRGSQATLG